MKSVARLIPLLLLAVLLGAQPHIPARAAGTAAAGGPAPFTFLGGLGGKIFGSAIDGTLAYLLEGAHLTILDISDPDAPRLRSRTGIPGKPYSIAAANGYVYVLRYGTLWVYDARNPDAPVLARALSSNLFRLASMTVAEGRLWLDSPGPLRPFDLHDPTRPEPLGALTDAAQFQVAGPLVYIVNKNQGLTIWDVSDPRAPFLRGQAVPLGVSGSVSYTGVAVDDSTLYLAASVWSGGGTPEGTIFTYNVGDPAKPNLMASGTAPAERLELLDGKLLTTAPGELVLYAMTDPSHPARVTSVPLSNDPSHRLQLAGGWLITSDEGSWRLNTLGGQGLLPRGQYQTAATIIDNGVLAGDRLYAHMSGGIQIIDVSRPLSPTLQALIPLGYTEFNDVSIEGTRLLKPTRDALELIDASDPLSPTVRAVLPAARAGRLADGRAYVVSTADPAHPLFQVLDISDMASPSVLGSVPIAAADPDSYFHLLLDGNRAYVAQSSPFPTSTPVLTALDVSDPRQPRAGLPFIPASASLVPHGTLLLSLGTKLQVIDVRDINAPVMADYWSSGAQRGFQFVGSTLFVADYNGLAALDLRDPQHPTLLSRFRFADGSTGGLQILDGRAYTFSEGLRALDIRNPASMLPVAMTDAYVSGFGVADSYLYVWMWDGGLQIIQIHPERFTTPLLLPQVRKGV